MKTSSFPLIFFILLFCIISFSLPVNANINSDYTYKVECQSVYLTPELNDNVTFYKWRIETKENTVLTTNWINRTDNKTHHSLLSFNTTYYIYLVYKNLTLEKEVGKEINTPTAKSCAEISEETNFLNEEGNNDEETPVETSEYQNLFDPIPDNIKNFFGHPLVHLPLLIVFLTLFLHFMKKKKKKIVYIKTRK